MEEILKDRVRYINEGAKIVDHNSLGLILLLREDFNDSAIQRALNTTNLKLKDTRLRRLNGCQYYSLEERNNGNYKA